MRVVVPIVSLLLAILTGPSQAATTFNVPDPNPSGPLVLIAYGDMRFTQATETTATSPVVRRALVAKIAAEKPAVIFINGDIPWHGIASDSAA